MKHQYLARQKAILLSQQIFTQHLCQALHLTEVQGPLLTDPAQGVQDQLSGTERAARLRVPSLNKELEVVQSLAKWKRQTLAYYQFPPGEGILVQMQALRPDEQELSPIHSVSVDQWDWEQVIHSTERTPAKLRLSARLIYQQLRQTLADLRHEPDLQSFALPQIPPELTVVTTEELRQQYPDYPPKERELLVTQELGAVFIEGIGAPLGDGQPHDERAPDYDDWHLNGDLLVWHELLQQPVELTSMGIRVMPAQLRRQMQQRGCMAELEQPWHQQLLAGAYPATIGGGIGRSRLTMWLLQQQHIGQVQVSIWPDETYTHFPGLLK